MTTDDRDPRVDPRPGDRVESIVIEGEVSTVLKAPIWHGDPSLGAEPGVMSYVDSRYGSRLRSTMSIEVWRALMKDGKVLERGATNGTQ